MKKQIWIDTDLSAGLKNYEKEGYSDVDDAFAIMQLIKAKQVKIVGISAVFGNTKIEDAYSLCQKMNREFAAGKIPVHKGAAEALYLQNAQSNAAVEALANALKKQKLRILAIGPATNIALLVLRYPELKSQIEELVLVAGRGKPTDYFEIGNQGRRAMDLNFDLDTTAFQILLENGLPLVLCPFEISSKVWIKKEDLKKLKTGDKGSRWLAEVSENWLQQWQYLGAKGFNPFDVLASHYLLAPEDIISEKRNARMEIYSDDTQQDAATAFKNYLLCNEKPGFPVTYCFDVVEDFHKKLMQSFNN